MSEPRNHHFIPQFYLSQWRNPSGKVTVYSRPHKKLVCSALHPRSTGYEHDLYSLEQVAPEEQQSIETEFMRLVDDHAAPAIAKLLAEGINALSISDRSHLTQFIMSLLARHPDAVALAQKRGRYEMATSLAHNPEEYESLKGPSDPPTLLDFAMTVAPEKILNIGKSILPTVISDKRVGNRIFKMNWWTQRLKNSSNDFVTCDRPCHLEGNAIEGSCLIFLPLSPSVVLFVSNDQNTIDKIKRTHPIDLSIAINTMVSRNAAKYVYAVGRNHQQLVENYLGDRLVTSKLNMEKQKLMV